jgi:hypothetical protein
MRSFHQCGILSKDSLHSTLKNMMQSRQIANKFLGVALEEDELDGFDGLNAHDEASRELGAGC